ncbi:MAG: hypothetical protein WBL15_01755 [Phycisphaerae bacterium]
MVRLPPDAHIPVGARVRVAANVGACVITLDQEVMRTTYVCTRQ